jgi:hypothetical protein
MLYSGKIKSVKRNFVVVVLVCVIYNYFDMKLISQYYISEHDLNNYDVFSYLPIYRVSHNYCLIWQ